MLQERTHCEGKGLTLFFLILGFGFVALLTLPQTHNEEEPIINMASAPSAITRSMQPARSWPSVSRAWQPPQAGKFMQPVKARQPVQRVSALTSPDKPDHSTYPVTNAESQLEPSADLAKQGRRNMIATAFALAAAGPSARSWASEDSLEPAKTSAGSYAGSYSDIQRVAIPPRSAKQPGVLNPTAVVGTAKEGAVDAPPVLLGALTVASIIAAGLPALLSPGETAFEAQRENERGQRGFLDRQRKDLKTAPKRPQWWGQQKAAKETKPKKKSLFR